MSAAAPPVPRREIFAWALYDFANSAFTTTIVTVVFGPYLIRALDAPKSAWPYANAAAAIVAGVMMPIVGAACDYTARKKLALVSFWALGCVATAALLMTSTWQGAVALYILGLIGFEAGNAIYNAFLPEIAPGRHAAWVSSLGWAVGYIGGALHLVLALALITSPGTFGLPKDSLVPTMLAVATVGGWWFLFGIPTALVLRERVTPRPRPPGTSLFTAGFRKALSTIEGIKKIPTLARFTIAFLLFNDGITTVVTMASVFGDQELGMTEAERIRCFLLIQVIAVGGSFGFAWLSRRLREKPALVISLAGWCGIIVWAFFMRTKTEFWLLGVAVGLVLGGSQAIARSLQARFTPPACAGEFFGFYAITGKFAAALGPAMFGLTVDLTGSMRWGILTVLLTFGAGLWLLLGVNEDRGVAEAEAEERRLTAGAEGGQGPGDQ